MIMNLFSITMVVTLLLASGLAQTRTEPFQTDSNQVHIPPPVRTEPPPKPNQDAKISVEQFPIPIPKICPPGFPGCPPASNMVPVPFIILYLKKFASFLAGKSRTASNLLQMLFERAKEKAGPVEEFQWLRLMLFVAVPFRSLDPVLGQEFQWLGLLGMPFWSAVSSNLFGVVLAGVLLNLLVNLGLREAVVAGVALFFMSTFMWSVLRKIRKSVRPTLP